MVNRKMMNNLEIYNTALNYMNAFKDQEGFTLPVKVNFYLQKNVKTITEMAQDIESSRRDILTKYGTPQEENPDEISIPTDKVDVINQEIKDLFDLEQEVALNMLKLDWFDGIDMTPAQVSAISFMIDEEE